MRLPFNQYFDVKTLIFSLLMTCIVIESRFTYAENSTKRLQTQSNVVNVVGQDKKNRKVKMIESEINQTLVSIKKIIGSGKCSDNTSCAAVAIGQKACGGPQNFLPYSTQNTDVTRLTALSRKHQNLNRQLNKITGRMSNCMLLRAPMVSCQNQKCQKQ